MKSIESKIMALTGLAILIVAILGGGTGIRTLQVVSKYDSAKILNLTADTEAANSISCFLT